MLARRIHPLWVIARVPQALHPLVVYQAVKRSADCILGETELFLQITNRTESFLYKVQYLVVALRTVDVT